MKQCTKCLESFSLETGFYKSGKWFRRECKKCSIIKTNEWAKNNPEKVKKAKRDWDLRNPDKSKNVKKNWRENNKKQHNKNARNWALNNPEKSRLNKIKSQNKRRAVKKNNMYSAYTQEQVLKTYGTKCHICNLEIDMKAARKAGKKGWENGLHIDHLIAIANGGADTIENVRPAHGLCNLKKGAKETATAVPQLERAMIEKIEKR